MRPAESRKLIAIVLELALAFTAAAVAENGYFISALGTMGAEGTRDQAAILMSVAWGGYAARVSAGAGSVGDLAEGPCHMRSLW